MLPPPLAEIVEPTAQAIVPFTPSPTRPQPLVTTAGSGDVTVLNRADDLLERLWTTIPKNEPLWQKRLFSSLQGTDLRADDILNRVFPTTHITAHDVHMVDKDTGEHVQATRVILHGPDGEAVSFVSEGVRKSLRFLFQIYQPPPYSPALPLALKAAKGRNGGRYFMLEIAEAKAPATDPPVRPAGVRK